MHQYTFPQVCVEILIALSQGNKTPESLAEDGGRTMPAVLTSLEELMIDDYCYKMPNSTFVLSKMGRDLIQEINETSVNIKHRDELFDMRW